MGEQSLYEDFGKIFKPITEQQKKSSDEIVSKFTPLQEAIENMPPALPWGQVEGQPGVLPDAAAVAPAEHPLPINIGRIAEQYLRSSYGKGADHSHYELKDKNGQFYIGKDPIKTDGNDLVIKGKRYRGTPEIRFPTKDDMKNYGEIMVKADAIRHPINSETPYYEKSFKWKKFIKPIWDEYVKKTNKKQSEKRNVNRKKKQGKGFLPSDPNAV